MTRKLVAILAAALMTAGAVVGVVRSDNGFAMAVRPQPPAGAQAVPTSSQAVQFSTILTEAEAHQDVWSLPEVQQVAAQVRAQGVRPFTMTEATPDPQAGPGTPGAAYVIYFGEDHGDHVVRLQTYTVDAYTGQVAVRDALVGK